ncbi:hypothetical protein, partial [Microvirga brassicacearum]|uniref:hypothetical protein n=1 Tax=Microvirga brassicacearum TaxID=2580413 RepID=UPI001AED1420
GTAPKRAGSLSRAQVIDQEVQAFPEDALRLDGADHPTYADLDDAQEGTRQRLARGAVGTFALLLGIAFP